MNIKRIITWGIFIVIVGLIIFGVIASIKKSYNDKANDTLYEKVSDSDWSIGNATTSSLIIVEYSDFQCPACRYYSSIMDEVIKEYGDNTRFIYRNFPLPQHKNAIPAGKAAGAAGEQGKFWEMYSILFEKQLEWSDISDIEPIFTEYANSLNLDIEKYNTDYNSQKILNKINSDLKGGIKAGINSTPTFYINDKKIKTPQNYNEFKKLIDEATTTKI